MNNPLFRIMYIPRWIQACVPGVVWHLTRSDTVYLTFDDGPTPGITDSLLRVLERYDAQATFFQLGKQVERYPQLVRAVAEAGHTVGNHGWAHLDGWQTPAGVWRADAASGAEALKQVLGRPPVWFRPAYGHLPIRLRSWLMRRYRVALWEVMGYDWLPARSSAACLQDVLRLTRPGAVVVLHDTDRSAHVVLPMIEPLIQGIQARGWQLCALPDEDPGAVPEDVVPGKVGSTHELETFNHR